MAESQKTVFDGTVDWSLGQDAWHDPNRIQPNQYASGVNVSTRGGSLRSRPGYKRRKLTFSGNPIESKYKYSRKLESIWLSGKFQAAFFYKQASRQYAITVINGYVFITNLETFETSLLSEEIKANPYAPRLNWTLADGKVVIYDYPAYPLIIDGQSLERAESAFRIPISTIGAYNNNRLFVADDFASFTAGDGVGNRLTPDAPLSFEEVYTPSSLYVNQQFTLTANDGNAITAMGLIPQPDTATGIGPLFISTKNRVYTYAVNQPRSAWGQGQFGSVLLENTGIAGQRAFTHANSDVIFLSDEGNVHAFSTARNDASKWSNIPISREVSNYLRYSDASLRSFAVLGYHDNRIYISANPYRVASLDLAQQPVTDYAHGGFVILELEELASFLSQGSPVWAGLWTGVNPMELFRSDESLFVVSKDGNPRKGGENALYELEKEKQYDTVRSGERLIRSIVYTKEFDFQDAYAQKKLAGLNFHISKIGGKFRLKVEYKPSHSNRWLDYTEWCYFAPTRECNVPLDAFIMGLDTHEMKQIIFGDPEEKDASPINNDTYDTFRAVQFRITIEGESWVLEHFRTKANVIDFIERHDSSLWECKEPVKLAKECLPDWLIPEETICLK